VAPCARRRRASAFCASVSFEGRPICCPRFCARLRPSAVRVRIRSRSTSAKPPRTAIIKRPVLVPVSAHGSTSDRNCAFASTICLTMANRSKVLRARRSMRVTVTTSPGGEAVEQFEQFAPVAVRAGDFLAVNPGSSFGAQLLKLGVERLAVGADAGIAEAAVLRVCSGHILREA
jgi:hypothetical protein